MSESASLPLYKITVPITGTTLHLSVSGDYHFGVKGVSVDDITKCLKAENKEFKGNLFRLYMGDLIENALKTSVGHNYDIDTPDPQVQKDTMKKALLDVSKDLYGTKFKSIKLGSMSNVLQLGCTGNHEYRSRKMAGQWIERDMYHPAKIPAIGTRAIVELTATNKKMRVSRKYKIFFAHRPSSTTATSEEAILRCMRRKRAEIPGCDIYAFGHFHKRFIFPDGYFDTDTGEFKKALYVVCPSPMANIEYADVAGYAPLLTGYTVRVQLPLDPNQQPFGIV